MTRLAGVATTNMSSVPPGFGAQNEGDLKDAPSNAVVVELSTFEGGPQGIDDCATRGDGLRGDRYVGPGDDRLCREPTRFLLGGQRTCFVLGWSRRE
ncbi:MAG: hypothetical protein ACRDLB_16620 [Actinomycetota bacterium]